MRKSVAPEQIASAILVLRGHRVLLDAELAALYGVTTKRLNEQVKRNAARFPADFIFRLTATETVALNQKHRDPLRKYSPYVAETGRVHNLDVRTCGTGPMLPRNSGEGALATLSRQRRLSGVQYFALTGRRGI